MSFGFVHYGYKIMHRIYYSISVSLERKIYMLNIYVLNLKIKSYENDYIVHTHTYIHAHAKKRMDLIFHDILHKYPN